MAHLNISILVVLFPPDAWHSDQRVLTWFHQTREFCFSWSESPLGVFWQIPTELSYAFYRGVASVWPFYHKGLIGRVLQRWFSFWKVLPSPQRNWSSVRVNIGFLITSPTKALLPQLLSSRNSFGGSKLLPFKYDVGHCVLGDL